MQFIGARSVAECLKILKERSLHPRLAALFFDHAQVLPFDAEPRSPAIPSKQRLVWDPTSRETYECPALAWLAPNNIVFRKIDTPPTTAVGRWRRYQRPTNGTDRVPAADMTRIKGGITFIHGASLENLPALAQGRDDGPVLALQSMPTSDEIGIDSLHFSSIGATGVDPIRLDFIPLTGYHQILETSGNLITRLMDCQQLNAISLEEKDSLYLEAEDGSLAEVIAGNPGKGMLAIDPQAKLELCVGHGIRLGVGQRQCPALDKRHIPPGLRLDCVTRDGGQVPLVAGPICSEAAIVSLPGNKSFVLQVPMQSPCILGGALIRAY